ncbi:hypothetical protein L227DRAFT_52808 [Lentinus tigrinus ALCF2SS1-6]|uniref:Uncharacterized protein n=1 Tax=Lentinus tigrinus ALCF2SS1-6 TaxID=1328759 RepID=A0A5C2SCJ7_9APHY|nr:hypothetical protein L227DRAFT_52808 [Lentinus tigrinus ALCF2SS1-6]
MGLPLRLARSNKERAYVALADSDASLRAVAGENRRRSKGWKRRGKYAGNTSLSRVQGSESEQSAEQPRVIARWVATRCTGSRARPPGSRAKKVTQSRPLLAAAPAVAAGLLLAVSLVLHIVDARTGRTGDGKGLYLYAGVGRGYHAACLVSSPPLAQI